MPTLRSYRRLFSSHAGGGLKVGTATSGSSTTYLEDTRLRSSIEQEDQWLQWWLLRPDAADADDQVHQVDHVDLPQGFIYPDLPPGDTWAIPYTGGTGEAYELHGPWFHPTEQIHAFINEALKLCRVPGEVAIPTLSTTFRQAVSLVHPWLTDGSSIFQVGQMYATEDRSIVDPYGRPVTGHPDYSIGDLYLAHPHVALASGLAAPLSADMTDSQTTASMGALVGFGDAADFPDAPFYLSIDYEILYVTSKVSPYLWNVTRGVFGTTPAAHSKDTSRAYASPLLFLRGLFPAYYLCRPAGGTYGRQWGLALDTDEALPAEQWVVAGALKEAWTSAPQVMEQLAESHRMANLQQASAAFGRWQELTLRNANLKKTFRDLAVATL